MSKKISTTKYFIYARKSEENDERQVQSIDDQVNSMKRLARERCLSIAQVFTEEKSAKEPYQRPVFEDMVSRLTRGEAEGILTWKIDRLLRNPIDEGTLKWMLQQGAIRSIVTPEREYRPEDNVLLIGIESSMATQYSRDLSRNVRRGLYSKAEKGWLPTIAPLGYLNTKKAERGTNSIVTDPERFPLLRRAWEHMIDGHYLPEQILRKLNNEWGFRTRKTGKRGNKPLSRSGLYKIFTNPFYMGIFDYGGRAFKGRHQPMVTPGEFDRVQELLGRKGKPKYERHRYAYTGLINCGRCGGRVSATTIIKRTARSSKQYVLYFCPRARRRNPTCSARRYINVNALEGQFQRRFTEHTVNELILIWAMQILDEDQDGVRATVAALQKARQKALEDTQRQLKTLTALRLRELLDDEEYEAERLRLKRELIKLERSRDSAETDALNLARLTKHLLRTVRRGTEIEEIRDPQMKRETLSALCLNCTLIEGKARIEAPSWLQSLVEDGKRIEGQMKVLEPIGQGSARGRIEIPGLLRPQMRALVDNIRTAIKQEIDQIKESQLKCHKGRESTRD